MQPQEIQKIKELIEASSLLSPGEKQEWLALMNIMNEKQLRELRNILESAFLSPFPNPAPLQGKGARQEIPALTHIMNMPKAGTAVFPKSAVSNQQSVISKKEDKAGEKTGFWKKIKDVLAEKELPPGHAEPVSELELPAPGQTSAIKTAGLTGFNRGKTLTSGLKAPVPQKKPPEVPAAPGQAPNVYIGTLNVDNLTLSGNEPMQVGLSLAKPQAEGAQSSRGKPPENVLAGAKPQDFLSGLKNKIAEHTAAAGPTDDYSIYSAISGSKPKSEAAAGKPAENFFVAGLKDTGILMDAKFKPAGNTGGGPRQSMEIANLQAASKLSEQDVSKDIVPPLKKLVAAYGYHNLVLALEKSPLFKAYINTGLSALSGKAGLDESKPGFLRRQDFERFVDVLREIKK